MEKENEEVCLQLSVSAAAGLNRLARYYQISKDEVVDRLIKKADSSVANEATRKGGVKGQTVYYEVPKS